MYIGPFFQSIIASSKGMVGCYNHYSYSNRFELSFADLHSSFSEQLLANYSSINNLLFVPKHGNSF